MAVRSHLIAHDVGGLGRAETPMLHDLGEPESEMETRKVHLLVADRSRKRARLF